MELAIKCRIPFGMIIRAINGTELVDLIVKYYEDLDEKYQRIIPLEKVYIPVSREK